MPFYCSISVAKRKGDFIMATIKKQGKGYKLTVSRGYDINGKQLRDHMTWTPAPGMTDRQIEKELNRQAVKFEGAVRNNTFIDNRIKFEAFAEKYMGEFGSLHLKKKTFRTYTENLVKINAAIGHIKLCDLKPTHINQFYKNLQEEGVRGSTTAVCKADIDKFMKQKKMTITAFAASAGVSRSTVNAAMCKNHILERARRRSAVPSVKSSLQHSHWKRT